MPCYTVRCATYRDLDSLLRIESSSFVDPFSFSFFEEILGSHGCMLLVVDHQEEIMGYVMAAAEQGECHILSIAVKSSMRRQGIGEALLTALVKQLLEMNIFLVYLEVRENNQNARSFYKHLGFAERNVISGYYRDGENAIVMVRRFAKSNEFRQEEK